MKRENVIKELIKQRVLQLGSELAEYRVFLFGSRVTGQSRERSDFDIGILGDRPISLHTFYRLEDMFDDIETLYKIDLVDLNRASDTFRTEALKAVEPLCNG